MKQLRPFEAIIFDHDGTLIDTETADYEACRRMCQENGLTLSVETWAEKVVGYMDGYHALFEELLQQNHNGLTPEKMWRRLHELWPITLQDATLMPGVTDLLPQLQAAGYPLAVATASDRAWANRWLTHFNLLPYFPVIATSDDIVNNKPAPDVYLHAAGQLGVPPQRCLVFEDSVAGATAARAAGMTVVAVPTHVTRSLNFSQAHTTITGLDAVNLAWIERLAETIAANHD